MKKVKEALIPRSKLNQHGDVEFWQKCSANVRFSALWLMVEEFYKIRGKNARKLRLQRSIQNIKQIPS